MKNKEMTNEGERRDKRKRQKEGRGPTNKVIKK